MFNSEKELVSYITSYVSESSDIIKEGIRSVFTELDLGYGIADVVAVSYKESSCVRENFLEYFDISILSLIEKEERVSFEDIVYITKSPTNRVNLALSSLMKENFIVYRNGYYFSEQKYAESLTDSIAIEAKLKDWKRALKQAYRYKWFSNKSFVFLPLDNIAVARENLDLFIKYNVGLASVSKEKGVEVIYPPVDEKPISTTMRIALNEYLLAFQDEARLRGL